MASLASDDPIAMWPTDPRVKEEIESYREKAKGVFEAGGFKTWTNPTGESRLGTFDFHEEDETPVSSQPSSPEELWLYLEKAISGSCHLRPSRHLILFEGFSPRLAEVFGLKLGVPPEFWLTHLQEDRNLHIVDSSVMNIGSSMYWRVPVPQLNFIPGDPSRPRGRYEFHSGGHFRCNMLLDHEPEYKHVFNSISYWGRTYSGGAWITLIFMDTTAGVIRPGPSLNFTYQAISQLATEEDAYEQDKSYHVMVTGSECSSRRLYPMNKPIWEISMEAYKTQKLNPSDNPYLSTAIVRNVILAAWEMYSTDRIGINNIWVKELKNRVKIEPIQHEEGHEAFVKHSENAIENYLNLSNERQLSLQRIYDIGIVITQFRCDDDEYLRSQQGRELWPLLAGEARRWRVLLDRFKWAEGVISKNMAMYAQRAALEEALSSKLQAFENYQQTVAANKHAEAATRMARSSGQLAKIATVAVPCTVAASIFSMNGDFAAGERLFFVYWCVAIPTTLALLGWVIQKDIVNLIKEIRGSRGAETFPDDESSYRRHNSQSRGSYQS